MTNTQEKEETSQRKSLYQYILLPTAYWYKLFGSNFWTTYQSFKNT